MKISRVRVYFKYFYLPTAELRCSLRIEKETHKKYFKLSSQMCMCTLILTCLCLSGGPDIVSQFAKTPLSVGGLSDTFFGYFVHVWQVGMLLS